MKRPVIAKRLENAKYNSIGGAIPELKGVAKALKTRIGELEARVNLDEDMIKEGSWCTEAFRATCKIIVAPDKKVVEFLHTIHEKAENLDAL